MKYHTYVTEVLDRYQISSALLAFGGRLPSFLLTLYHTTECILVSEGETAMDILSIGQVARRAGVGVETVRFYEREGLLVEEPPRR